jgi:hypothetical protein
MLKDTKMTDMATCKWLLPVILATQEVKIRRITVQSKPGGIVHETLLKNNQHEKGLEAWFKW